MTYRAHYAIPSEWCDQIAEEGLDILPQLIRTLINTAMWIERQQYLGVEPYERSPERRGRANGYKSKDERCLRRQLAGISLGRSRYGVCRAHGWAWVHTVSRRRCDQVSARDMPYDPNRSGRYSPSRVGVAVGVRVAVGVAVGVGVAVAVEGVGVLVGVSVGVGVFVGVGVGVAVLVTVGVGVGFLKTTGRTILYGRSRVRRASSQ